MACRAEIAGDVIGASLVAARTRLLQLEIEAASVTDDHLEELVDEAQSLAQLRAYLCPIVEVATEGISAIALMEEWGVPAPAIVALRQSVIADLKNEDAKVSRGALRSVFEEFDSWSDYSDDYVGTISRVTWVLLIAILGLSSAALVTLRFPKAAVFGLLIAGCAGSCASVIRKLPPLTMTSEFETSRRSVLVRIGTGTAASLIGCAFLTWGLVPIAIREQTFSDILNACASIDGLGCTGAQSLILAGVAALFGFSERLLTSIEDRVLPGHATSSTDQRS